MPEYISDRPLYLTADKNSVVEEGDPAARYVLVGTGGTVPAGEVERLGLHNLRPAPVAAPVAGHVMDPTRAEPESSFSVDESEPYAGEPLPALPEPEETELAGKARTAPPENKARTEPDHTKSRRNA